MISDEFIVYHTTVSSNELNIIEKIKNDYKYILNNNLGRYNMTPVGNTQSLQKGYHNPGTLGNGLYAFEREKDCKNWHMHDPNNKILVLKIQLNNEAEILDLWKNLDDKDLVRQVLPKLYDTLQKNKESKKNNIYYQSLFKNKYQKSWYGLLLDVMINDLKKKDREILVIRDLGTNKMKDDYIIQDNNDLRFIDTVMTTVEYCIKDLSCVQYIDTVNKVNQINYKVLDYNDLE